MRDVTKEPLSSIVLGVENAAQLFAKFSAEGNEELESLRTSIISPDEQKQARIWSITEAAKLIGRHPNSLRLNQDVRQKDARGAWVYSLDDINYFREKYGTRYKRPAGSQAAILAVSNFKGGVAKTTTTVHLAQKAAIDGLRVLVVDLDPQASTTFNLGPLIPDMELGPDDIINNAMTKDPQLIKSVICDSYFPGIRLVPSNLHLQSLEFLYTDRENEDRLGVPAERLSRALEVVREDYDIILLDCGPNMGAASLNAMAACNAVLIPIPPSTYDHASFVMLSTTLTSLFASLEKSLDYLRIVITKHPGNKGSALVENRIRKLYGEYVLNNVVSMTAEIEKASAEMSSVYDQVKGKNNRRQYQRAIDIIDAVNNEIIDDLKLLWNRQAEAAKGVE
ncbi:MULTISPECIES: AAA family ATPase [Pseudomonas]|jgi:chromosome partitioning protein|uniref:AAA family ATPase n=1 Tax=Pseudomonas luteola TaxID=47886 RepID=A0ABS0MXL8_PSELU|nr:MULTISPECIES: AAA family ATPase [Pseudomonas]MBA1250380.1 AAA family ATPase [Pseudomonas zeshuii]MBH3441452.1 AAA family ATPase [Pseudomonas luteola]MBW5415289.1 AAA family ATPase [Pseudomonas sp. MAG002Y]QEU26604.1 AAA family ATPase [Pseudomonas luteola]RRW43173.1 hypothetical protein EGJ50_19285 [Pseudomonas luteola]